MNTDVITMENNDSITVAEKLHPVENYIEEATLPSRQLKLKELPPLRAEALTALEEHYGTFSPEVADRIENPIHRFIMLGEMSSKAWGKSRRMDKLRADRRTAIQILYYDYGWKPMQMVRHMEADDRRVVDFAILAGDKEQRPSWSEQRAMDVAKRTHADYVRTVNYGDAARPERDRLILELSEGRWEFKATRKKPWKRLSDEEMERRREAKKPLGRIWTNAELSRLGHMSSAAVAQIRTHTAPSMRRLAAAAA